MNRMMAAAIAATFIGAMGAIPAHALVTVFAGADAAQTANSGNAFAAWSATVSSFGTESFDGFLVTGGSTGATPIANTFVAAAGSTMSSYSYSTGVIDGANLQLTKPLRVYP
jgi:hypothetical protein